MEAQNENLIPKRPEEPWLSAFRAWFLRSLKRDPGLNAFDMARKEGFRAGYETAKREGVY